MLKNFLIVISIVSLVGYFAGKRWTSNSLTGETFLWVGGVSTIILAVLMIREANFFVSTRTYVNTFGILVVFLTGIFGLWGAFSNDGKKRFDEMDGIIPYLAMAVAALITATLIILNIIWILKSKSK